MYTYLSYLQRYVKKSQCKPSFLKFQTNDSIQLLLSEPFERAGLFQEGRG